MTVAPDRIQLAEDHRRMMDELCTPELTLARAEVLRPQVAHILAAIREVEPAPRLVRRGEGR